MSQHSEIVSLVRSKESAIAWVIHHTGNWYAILFVPDGGKLQILMHLSKDALMEVLTETRDETGLALRIVEGHSGIAATDPHWDGSRAFVCDNPACGKIHDVDENVAVNLVKRAAVAKQPRRPAKRKGEST